MRAGQPTVHVAGAVPLMSLSMFHWMLLMWTPSLTSNVTQPMETEPGLVLNWPPLKSVPAVSRVTEYFTVAPLLLVSVAVKVVPTGPVVELLAGSVLVSDGALVEAFAAGASRSSARRCPSGPLTRR